MPNDDDALLPGLTAATSDDAGIEDDVDPFPSDPESVSPTFPDQGSVNPRAPSAHKDPVSAGAQITRHGYSWASRLGTPTAVSYAFRASGPTYLTLGSATASTFSVFNPTQIATTLAILDLWSDVANIVFVRAGAGITGNGAFSNNASILLGNYRDPYDGSGAFTYLPSPSLTAPTSAAGDVWDNAYYPTNTSPTMGSYGWLTLLHELGHSIGLEHPGDYNVGSFTPTYENSATYFEDSRQYSDMSYFAALNTGANHGGYYAATPLLDDITAAQRLYGANPNTRTGNTTYGFNSNADRDVYRLTSAADQRVMTIYDAGGFDTLDLSGYATNQVISLNPGTFSSTGSLTGNLSIAQGTIIENAIGGSGNDTFYGNSADNVIDGRGGTDTIVYSGRRADYTVHRDGAFIVLADSVAGRDGTDYVTNVEQFRFADLTVSSALIDAPSFAITAASARRPEGNSGATPFTFTVTRSVDLTQPFVLAWSAAGNGANPANAADFVGGTLPYGTLTFAPGDTTKTITVYVAGDTRPEGDETFSVGIVPASGTAFISAASVTGTILDDDVPAYVGISNNSARTAGSQLMEAASPGGPDYLVWQYIYAGSDSVAVATAAPNTFIHTGSGNDAIQSGGGNNVLDGGLGSNFMTGGAGQDTFFTDARAPGVVWNTVRNFGAGDAATLWGFVPGVSSYRWDTSISGAAGSQGATLRANIVGGAGRSGDGIDASITFTGLSVAQAQNLQVATGTQAAGSYLYLYNPGV